MRSVLINGNFLARAVTGVERFALSVTEALDGLVSPESDVCLLAPKNARFVPSLKSVKVVVSEDSAKSFPFWDLGTFARACRAMNLTALDFCNTAPLGKRCGFAFIHDIYSEDFPEEFKKPRERLIASYCALNYRNICRNAKKIFTVSKFSASRIMERFNVDERRIAVATSGWDAFGEVEEDGGVFKKFPGLKKGEFYFTLGSLQKRKNLRWTIDCARKHPGDVFAVSGGIARGHESDEIGEARAVKNVMLLGYLSDGEVKALMRASRAFVFPSLYEGFGLPPLEALSCGAQAIVSDIPVHREIYGGSVRYLDPKDTDTDLREILARQKVSPPGETLAAHTCRAAAKKIFDIISDLDNRGERG